MQTLPKLPKSTTEDKTVAIILSQIIIGLAIIAAEGTPPYLNGPTAMDKQRQVDRGSRIRGRTAVLGSDLLLRSSRTLNEINSMRYLSLDNQPPRDNQSAIVPNVPKLRRIIAPTLARVRQRRQWGYDTPAERILEGSCFGIYLGADDYLLGDKERQMNNKRSTKV